MSKSILDDNALTDYGGIFKSTAKGADRITLSEGESIVGIPLDELHALEIHPFQVNEVICCKGYKIRTYYNTGSYAIFEV